MWYATTNGFDGYLGRTSPPRKRGPSSIVCALMSLRLVSLIFAVLLARTKFMPISELGGGVMQKRPSSKPHFQESTPGSTFSESGEFSFCPFTGVYIGCDSSGILLKLSASIPSLPPLWLVIIITFASFAMLWLWTNAARCSCTFPYPTRLPMLLTLPTRIFPRSILRKFGLQGLTLKCTQLCFFFLLKAVA